MTQPLRIVVAIPTYKRPQGLTMTLPMVIEQARSAEAFEDPAVEVSVLVVDNDAAASASTTVAGFDGVRYAVEPTPGIASARNRALDEAAGADAVVFIDDDEHPQPEWLSSLLRTWSGSDATAVMGRVLSVFDVEPDPWIAAGDFFRRRSMTSGTEIEIAAAGNLLIDLNRLRQLGVRFDERLGTGGGEDTLLSLDIRHAGGRIIWCEESATIDRVPAERLTRQWLSSRFFHHGNTHVVVRLLAASTSASRLRVRAGATVGGITRVGWGRARGAFGRMRGSLSHQAKSMATVQRGRGMLAAARGRVHREYARNDSDSE